MRTDTFHYELTWWLRRRPLSALVTSSRASTLTRQRFNHNVWTGRWPEAQPLGRLHQKLDFQNAAQLPDRRHKHTVAFKHGNPPGLWNVSALISLFPASLSGNHTSGVRRGRGCNNGLWNVKSENNFLFFFPLRCFHLAPGSPSKASSDTSCRCLWSRACRLGPRASAILLGPL